MTNPTIPTTARVIIGDRTVECELRGSPSRSLFSDHGCAFCGQPLHGDGYIMRAASPCVDLTLYGCVSCIANRAK
jgi:hypothetical protein